MRDGLKKKDSGGKEKEKEKKKEGEKLKDKAPPQTPVKSGKEIPSSVSPILASSLGLNKIKTRSGPLPQESFFGFRGEKSCPSSNLSKSGGNGGKKKEVAAQSRIGFLQSGGSASESVSTGTGASKEQSPNVLPRSRLQNAESSNASGIILLRYVRGYR